MKRILAATAALTLSGCMSSMGLQGMSAEQIKAMGKESNVSWFETVAPWGSARGMFMNIDKSVIDEGGLSIGKDGTVEFRNKRQFAPPKIADPKLPALPELQWATPKP